MPSKIQDILNRALSKEFSGDLFGESFTPLDYVSTSLPSLDHALGTPGFACGRLTVIYGDPGSGKSTLLHTAMAECQRQGGLPVLIETEDAVDRDRMAALGVDLSNITILQPGHLEETIDIIGRVIELVRKESPDQLLLIGWDSVAATPTKREVEGDSGESTMGLHARLISQMLRKYSRVISKNRICLVMVNQSREKIGGMPFADNDVMIADKPMRFWATHILKVARRSTIKGDKKDDDPTGIVMKVQVKKNKLAPPFREVEVELSFSGGFNMGGSWLDAAEATRVLNKVSNWYALPDGTKLQRAALEQRFETDAELQELVRAAILAAAPADAAVEAAV